VVVGGNTAGIIVALFLRLDLTQAKRCPALIIAELKENHNNINVNPPLSNRMKYNPSPGASHYSVTEVQNAEKIDRIRP
jgi:hypothetical protein